MSTKINVIKKFDKYNLVYHAKRTHKTMFVASGVIEGYLRVGNDSLGYLHNAIGIISNNNEVKYYLQQSHIIATITQMIDKNCNSFTTEILESARNSYTISQKRFEASKSLSSFEQLAVLIEITPVVLQALATFSSLFLYIGNDEKKQKKISLLFGDIGKERNKVAHLYSEIDTAVKDSLEKVSKKIHIPFSELKYMLHHEAQKLVTTKVINKKLRVELQKRSKPFLVINIRKGSKCIIYNQKLISSITNKYDPLAAGTSVQGKSVFPGKVTGHIVNIRSNANVKIPKDAIVVAPMTIVDDYPSLKNCLAIVTDEGGLLSHAAIIARELKKPCVIGTKNATKTFKDGDIVEVDANNGIVRKIK